MRDGLPLLRYISLGVALSLFVSSAWAQSNQMSQSGQTNPACGTPAALDDGWTIASPEAVGLDGARLCGIAVRLKEIEADVHAVVIVRHGKLVFEQYFSGYD